MLKSFLFQYSFYGYSSNRLQPKSRVTDSCSSTPVVFGDLLVKIGEGLYLNRVVAREAGEAHDARERRVLYTVLS